jgi:cytochrome c biogenesis protein
MSVAEETIKEQAGEVSQPKTASPLDIVLNFLSSVRFGVVLLCVLVLLSMVGMLIIQQNVQGFDAYYASLTPAEKLVFGSLGLFDIYHSWYFNFLLLVLSLNIVLASIDRFPSAWSFISRPKLDASRRWLLGQKQNAVVNLQAANKIDAAEKVSNVFKKSGLSAAVTEKKGNLFVFGESGKWNRLGAYIVHVFLLTLFLGHFVALQTGFDADVRMMPGEQTNEIQLIEFNLDKQERFAVGLPFTISCTDIQQTLIDPKGEIEIGNTLDWRTQIKIDDPAYGSTIADVSLNKPFEYRGYRFFQASAITVGSARTMTLEVAPENGGQPLTVNLMRNGSADLPDGTKIEYEAFFPDFVLNQGKPDTRTAEYNNPAVVLNITTAGGEKKKAYAFGAKMPDNIPIGAPVAGYKWRLADFEKSPLAHVLSIKYDPFNAAFVAWYIGGFGLIGALCFVFFISHKRIWALVEDKGENDYEIVFGGNTNRSEQAFEDKFKKIIDDVTTRAEKSS